MMDEYLDLVDAEDNVIGQQWRSVVHAEKLSNFRAINAFLVNPEGLLWIPRRSSHKRLFPGCFDVGVGGHVESGETYEETFKREVAEELSLDVDKLPWKRLGYLKPHLDGVRAFMMVYEISIETAPVCHPDEFSEAFWFKPADLLKKIEAGEPAKTDLPALLKRFYI